MSKKAIQYCAVAVLSIVAYSYVLTFFPMRSFPIKELLAKVFSFFACLLLLLLFHNKNIIKDIIGRVVCVSVIGAGVVSAFDGIYSATKQVLLVCSLTMVFWLIVIGFFVAPIIDMHFKNVLQLLCNKKSTVIILCGTVVAIMLTYGISTYRNISISGLLGEDVSLLSYLGLLANQRRGAVMMIVDIIFIVMFFGLFTHSARENTLENE